MASVSVVGVWMGRSDRADRCIRPVLDAAQTMPAFVYLVPFLALFGASRFTAIVAAVVFAAPVGIKIVADGIRGVPPTDGRGRHRAGSSRWQIITKVQLPMARRSLALAANQGLHLRAVDGRRRRPGRRAARSATTSSPASPGRASSARAWPRASPSSLLGVMLDRITQARRRARPAARTRRSSQIGSPDLTRPLRKDSTE